MGMMDRTEADDIDRCPVVRSPSSCYWKDMWQRMNSMRLSLCLCDVTLVTDSDDSFHAHSSVLAASCDSFYAYFTESHQYSKKEYVIKVSDLSTEALGVTLEFIYGITPANKHGYSLLLHGAQKIGISGAIHFCERKLEELEGRSQQKCPLKDPQLMQRVIEEQSSSSSAQNSLSSLCNSSLPLSVLNKGFINDLTAKFVEEVLSRHLNKRQNETGTTAADLFKDIELPDHSFNCTQSILSLADGVSEETEFIAIPDIQLDSPSPATPADPPLSDVLSVPSEASHSYSVSSDVKPSDFGTNDDMPMDIHHSLIPEMTLNDLTRAPDCPHLKKLVAASGLEITEEEENNNIDYNQEITISNNPSVICSTSDCNSSSVSPAERQNTSANASPNSMDLINDQKSEKHNEQDSAYSLNSPRVTYKCEDCSLTMPSLKELKMHCVKEHGKPFVFRCDECDFQSTRKKDIQSHMLSKHKKAVPGLRVFKCDQCGYMCMDKNRYKEHLTCHSGIAKFSCKECNKSYTTRRGLYTHMQYHSQERPHKCTECGKSFKVRDKLRDHIRLIHTHKGEKPFKCSYCDHASALRGNCNQHIRNTHPGKPIKVIDIRKKTDTI